MRVRFLTAQQVNDFERKASPMDDDRRETIARIEAALPSAAERDLRLLVAELGRLKGGTRND